MAPNRIDSKPRGWITANEGIYPFHLKGTHLFRFNGPFFDLFKLVLFTPE